MKFLLGVVLSAFAVFPAHADEVPQKKNSWTFKSQNGNRLSQGSMLVVIKPVQNENRWTLEALGQISDIKVEKASDLEPFVVSADFQNWSNYYQDNIGNCDSFNVQDSPYKSVCFSRLAGKNNTKAMIGLLFGGSGQAGQRYDTELVEQAINSIDPADVASKLDEFEAYRRSSADNQKLRMLMR